jgi:transcriptional regulator
MGDSSAEPLRGTIDLLLLRALILGPTHGWGITLRIQEVTRGVLEVNQGSLYPALQRLEQKDWIDSEWRVTENNRRAKYYRLTPAGRIALKAETRSWRRLVSAVELMLEAT